MAKDMEERREQIMNAALHVFSHKGFGKATMKDIAQEAGITPGLIYYYFKSKEELLRAVIEKFDPIHHLRTPPNEQSFALPAEVFLRNLFTRMLDSAEEQQFVGLIRVALSEVLHGDNTDILQLVPEILGSGLSFLTGYLDAKMEAGELRRVESEAYAQIIVNCLIGFVLRRQLLRDPLALQYSHEQIASLLVETVLRGLTPR